MAAKNTKSKVVKTAKLQPLVEDVSVKSSKKVSYLYMVIILLLVALVGLGVFGYFKYRQLTKENSRLSSDNQRLSNPEESAKTEIARLKSDIAKLVEVPSGEEPTIATVTEIGKLKDNPFYAKAENGDKVFIYAMAKKAFIYRPRTNKIIEVAAINPQDETSLKQDGIKDSSNDLTKSPTSTNSETAPPPTE